MELMHPICMGCKHLHQGYELTCDAFPARIPDPILESRVDHRHPVEGDHDIQFDAKTPEDAEYAASLFAEAQA